MKMMIMMMLMLMTFSYTLRTANVIGDRVEVFTSLFKKRILTPTLLFGLLCHPEDGGSTFH
jgi:hypothetical protein